MNIVQLRSCQSLWFLLSMLEEGDYKGAVRLTCSSDSILPLNEETMTALKAKHPAPHPNSCVPPPPEGTAPCCIVTDEEVAQTICSFPCGSAGGLDGIRPQHLRNPTSPSAEGGGVRLLQSLTAFSNLVLQGKTPTAVRPFFFGANLIALGKKGGGVRPIAVGLTLRRLAAKCAGSRFLHSVGPSMAPLQLGCGIPQGCKAAVHAARMYIQDLPSSHVLLKLDFQNAFNTLRRDCMLNAVRESAQELYHFIHSAYEKPSNLFCGGQVIHSSEGIQQGDPLGCFLFCLTIHPLVKSLQSELRIFYVDDGTLRGHKDEVMRDLQTVESEAAKLGLQLNRHKSELICDDIGTREAMMEEAPGLQTVKLEEAEILGAPLGKSVDDNIQRKVEKLRLMGDRLHLLQSQDALLLLRHSFAIPKVMHILRSSPCFSSPQLKVFDDALRDILGDIINARIDDSAWAQASLPVRSGVQFSWHHLPFWPLLLAALD